MAPYRTPSSIFVPVETLRRIRETLKHISSMPASTDEQGVRWWLRVGEANVALDELLKGHHED